MMFIPTPFLSSAPARLSQPPVSSFLCIALPKSTLSAFLPSMHSGKWVYTCASLLLLAALTVLLRFALDWLRDLRRRAAESDRNRARFFTMAACSADAVLILETVRSPAGEIEDFLLTFLNGRAYELLDLPPESLQRVSVRSLFPLSDGEGLLAQYRDIVLTGNPSVDEFAVAHPAILAKWLRVSALRFEDGVMLTVTDLTEQKDFERQLCHMAFHDPLTKLPNRALLDDRIQQAIERAKRNRGSAAVLILDIDDFKQINDTHGHAAGDFVLKTVANRLRDAVRASDSVFRLGGDEFVLVFCDVSATGPVADFARKVVINLLSPIVWQQHSFNISASIGLAMYPLAGTTPETLLVQADIEMYRMKRSRSRTSQAARRLQTSGRAPLFPVHRP